MKKIEKKFLRIYFLIGAYVNERGLIGVFKGDGDLISNLREFVFGFFKKNGFFETIFSLVMATF